MSGEIAKAILGGARVTITPDCWPLRREVKEIQISMTKKTWNGTTTLGRTISVKNETPERVEEEIIHTIKEMDGTIETSHNWRG